MSHLLNRQKHSEKLTIYRPILNRHEFILDLVFNDDRLVDDLLLFMS